MSVQVSTKEDLVTLPTLKTVRAVKRPPQGHWVGDGFPVRTIFAYDTPREVTPFLLMDYAGPLNFAPSETRRGVGEHPHRGFETVTIMYSGEVEHRDSSGGGGKIGPGDVQWMTAGSGLVHEEMHSDAYSRSGGTFEAIQLWVNLPRALKMTPPKYQTLQNADIPNVPLPNGAGQVRVIAGAFGSVKGPAETFSPVHLWDIRLKAGHSTVLDLPEGHTSGVFVLKGNVRVNGTATGSAEFAILERQGSGIRVEADSDTVLLVLGGEPIDDPVAGYGPFVMSTEAEIHQAVNDFRSGRMGRLPSS